MLYNNLKMAFRYLVRNKAVSTIKIIGLAVALAFCILVYFYVDHENSFDRFHPDAEQVYRMTLTNGEGNICQLPAVYGPEALKQFPEINEYIRLDIGGCFVKIDEEIRSINRIYADSNFFSFFHFPLKKGDPHSVLADPSQAVLSEQTAKNLFGSTDIIGKTISLSYAGNYHDYVIRGIVSNPPGNSSIAFDIILPMQRLFAIGNVEHMNINNQFATFIRIKENANIGDLQKKIKPLKKQFDPNNYERGWSIGLQSILDIHFAEYTIGHYNNTSRQGNINTLYILSSIALILLIVGCINFIIISIGSSIQRNKELGIRKTIGADKSQLVRQSYYESLLVTAIAIAIGFLLAFLLLPIFNQLLQVHIEAGRILNLHTFAFLFVLLILTSVFAGSWSFLMISKYEIHTLFGGGYFSYKKNRFQAICVIFQIIIAMIFLTSTFVMYQQGFLIKKKADQVNKVHAVCIDMNLSWQEMERGKSIIDVFRNEALKNPHIRSVTAVEMQNFYYNKKYPADRNFKYNENEALAHKISVDYNFIKTMGFEIRAGRDFTPKDEYEWTENNNTVNVIINEAMAKKLELQDAVGQTIRQIGGDSFNKSNANIIGVVKDFHFQSLHKKIEPVVLVYGVDFLSTLIVSMEPEDIHASLVFLNKKWRTLFPDKPFNYSFLSEQFEKMHATEIRWMHIILTSALLCIFITCSGLFGMALLMTEQRTKEIGIRKVLGASISKILTLLAQDIVLWFILALFVAFPIAWYAMHKWLQNFAYKIDLTIWPFLLAGVAALAIALLTISWQTIRAATANPVEALRYE